MAHVVVLGSGVAALTVALELLRRGQRVTLLDARDKPGGEARAQPVRLCASWRHVPSLLGLLPPNDALRAARGLPPGSASMLDLTDAAQRPGLLGALRPDHLGEDLRRAALAVPAPEREALGRALGVIRTSCAARLADEWERRSWGALLGEGARWGAALGEALTLAPADRASARAVGLALSRALTAQGAAHRALPAPLGEGCLDPWVEHLLSLGLDLRLGCRPEALGVRDGRVHHLVADDGARHLVEADAFVCALGLHEAARLVSDELRQRAPALGELLWLAEHSAALPWLLHEPWEGRGQRAELGVEAGQAWAGPLRAPASRFSRAPALGAWTAREGLGAAPSVAGSAHPQPPRFYPGLDTWRRRPEALTRVPNLMLAGLYVRARHDLGGLETEAETAREAANLALARVGSKAAPCPAEPPSVGARRTLRELQAQAQDAVRWRLGLPHAGTLA